MKKLLGIFSLWSLIIVGCETDSSGPSGAPGSTTGSGQGGSLARFTIMQDQLLAIDDGGEQGSQLKTFSLQNPANPQESGNSSNLSLGSMETLYPYSDSVLLIGGPTGMSAVRVAGSALTYLGNYRHVNSCDPVAAQGNRAYVSLRSESNSFCDNGVNELQVLDISDWQDIQMLSSRSLEFPRGLGMYGDSVLVCDDILRNFHYAPQDTLLQVDSMPEVRDPRDVIVLDQSVLLITDSGFEQYAIQNGKLQFLSEL